MLTMVALVITGAVPTVVMLSAAVPLPPALEAMIVILDVPIVLKVPVMAPVAVLRVSPVGKLDTA